MGGDREVGATKGFQGVFLEGDDVPAGGLKSCLDLLASFGHTDDEAVNPAVAEEKV